MHVYKQFRNGFYPVKLLVKGKSHKDYLPTFRKTIQTIANAIGYDTQNESKAWLMDTTYSVNEHGGIDQLEGSLLLTRVHDAYRY